MALFDSFKKKASPKTEKKEEKAVVRTSEKKEKVQKPKVPATSTGSENKNPSGKIGGIDLSMVIREPRITEKATMLADRGAYVFDVHQSATKAMIARAITVKFGVTPMKVSVLGIPGKKRQDRRTGKVSHTSSGRKAVVYLKKGDKIEFV